jgi:CheY-like chemotaxis protein
MFEHASIFLAEDSPADAYLFGEALRVHGVESELFVFDDGEKAISFLLQAENDGPRPQIFVLDLNLPKMDGREILRYLREKSRFATAPVLILTSSNDPSDREKTARLGVSRYVQKATDISEFLDIGRVVKTMLREISNKSPGDDPAVESAVR